MRRAAALLAVATVLVASLGVGAVAAQDAAERPCEAVRNGDVNESTYRQCINQLTSEKNTLQNKLVQLRGQVNDLQFELNQTGGEIPPSVAEIMKERGAWVNATNTPAVFRKKSTPEQINYYLWIGPADSYSGNGKTGFNGLSAWTKIKEVRLDNGDKELVLPDEFASLQGVKKRYTYSSPIEKQRIAAQLIDALNTPRGWNAANLYITNRLETRKSTGNNNALLYAGATMLVLAGGVGVGAYLNRSGYEELGWFDRKYAERKEAEREAEETGQDPKQVRRKNRRFGK